MYRDFRRAVLALGIVAMTGCTHWGTTTVYGDKREVNRVLIGSPHVAETRSSSGSAAFALGRTPDAAAGGIAGSAGSVTRKHCVQEAQIEYVQPYELRPVAQGRVNDIAAGALVSFLGLAVVVGAKIASTTIFEPGDPLYEPPPNPTAGYLIGGLSMIGGVGLIGYSFKRLPAGPAPAVTTHERRWQVTRIVESTGCGLVPGDRAGGGSTATPSSDVEERLRKLERLRKDGIISEKEYRKKKQKLLDEL